MFRSAWILEEPSSPELLGRLCSNVWKQELVFQGPLAPVNISALRPDSLNRAGVTVGSQNLDLAPHRPAETSYFSCQGDLLGTGSGRRGKRSPDGWAPGLQDVSTESHGAARGKCLSTSRKWGCFGTCQLMRVAQTKGQTSTDTNQPGFTDTAALLIYTNGRCCPLYFRC